jgi:hypothetical protein
MENKMILLYSVLLFLFSCNNYTKQYEDNSDKPIHEQFYVGIKDSILIEKRGDITLIYDFIGDSTYTIKWSSAHFDNKSSRKFDVLGNGVLGILDADSENIILEQSCGSSCITYVILPLKNKSVEKEYLFAKAYDLKNKLIAYVPEDVNVFIRVENFITGQTIDVKEDNLCPATFKSDCIDTIYFNKNKLVIKWQGKKWEKDKPDLQDKIIPINF